MPSIDLPLGWPSILRELIAGPGLWASAIELEERIGLVRHGAYRKRWTAIKVVLEHCREMVRYGWLDGAPETPDAPVMLSEAAAGRLGVRIDDAVNRWVGFDLRCLPTVRYYSFSPDQLSVFFEVPDPQPGPDELLIAHEERELATRPPAVKAPGIGPHWIWLWRRNECDHCRYVCLPDRHYCMCCGRPWWEKAA